MPRPLMGRRDRVRVEFGLPPELAERVYRYAKTEKLTLSRAGEHLLERGLSRTGRGNGSGARHPDDTVDT